MRDISSHSSQPTIDPSFASRLNLHTLKNHTYDPGFWCELVPKIESNDAYAREVIKQLEVLNERTRTHSLRVADLAFASTNDPVVLLPDLGSHYLCKIIDLLLKECGVLVHVTRYQRQLIQLRDICPTGVFVPAAAGDVILFALRAAPEPPLEFAGLAPNTFFHKPIVSLGLWLLYEYWYRKTNNISPVQGVFNTKMRCITDSCLRLHTTLRITVGWDSTMAGGCITLEAVDVRTRRADLSARPMERIRLVSPK